MNSFAITATNAPDVTARNLVVTFFSAGGSGGVLSSGRFASACVQCAGLNPSYALVGIPTASPLGPANWDQLPGVALNAAGPAGRIKLLSRAAVSLREGYNEQVLMNGWVVYHAHTVRSGEDSMLTCIFDDRHIMHSYYTCFGKMWYEPQRGKHYFTSNPNDPLVFNRGGHGDCIDSPFGPRFAPGHRYGHRAAQGYEGSDEPDAGQATSKARKWRCSDILRYLRDFFFNVGARPPLGQDFGLLQLPPSIDWPRDFGSNITEDRTPRELSLEGMTLLNALQTVTRYCGPYDLHMEPISQQVSRLKVVDFNPKDNAGAVIYDASYKGATIGEAMNNPCIAVRANVKESALAFAHEVTLTGDAPATEFMASTDPADTQAGAAYLAYGWERNTTEALFKAVVDQGNNDSKAFNHATNLYPDVYSWYRISSAKNPFDATEWAAQAQSGNFRIKPHQLTSYNEFVAPIGLVPREIVIEYKLTAEEYAALTPEEQQRGYWRFADRFSDLQLSPCGRYVQIPGLRNLPAETGGFCTWKAEGGTTYEAAFMQPRHIRIQVAVESDHCITARAGNKGEDPNFSLQRIDPSAPKFTLLMRSAPLQYVNWYRRTLSYPVGIGGLRQTQQAAAATWTPATVFTDEGNGTLTDPLNRIGKHAQIHIRNHKRVTYEGTFDIPQLTCVYKPGMAIAYENGNIVGRVYGVVRCVVFNHDGQLTQVEFGPSEHSVIWDGPLQIMQGGNGSGAPPMPKVDKDTKYDEPQETGTKTGTKTTDGSGKGSDTAYDSSGSGTGGVSARFEPSSPDAESAEPVMKPGESTAAPAEKAAPETKAQQSQRRADVAARKADEARAAGDFVAAEGFKKDANRLGLKAENARSVEAGKAAFPTTSVNGSSGFQVGHALAGAPNSGTVNGKPLNVGEIFGKPSSGSIGGIANLNQLAGKMFNTRAADALERQVNSGRGRGVGGRDPSVDAFFNRKRGPSLVPGKTGFTNVPPVTRGSIAAAPATPATPKEDGVDVQELINRPAPRKIKKADVTEE